MGLLVLSLLAGCGGGAKGTIIIGSKDFTEQYIVAEMYALLLEDAGLTVERKFGLAGTPVAQAAITAGEIDLYPEYTGTGLLVVLKLPVSSDRQAVYDAVAKGYKEQFDLVWLDPAPMNNTQALAVTQEVAQQYNLRTMSDLPGVASELIMIGPPEFDQREDGLPGIMKVYGDFQLKAYLPVEKGLRYKGLIEGDAQIVVAFGTDGEISANNLIVLEDDKGMFPPYQVAPVIRQAALDATPEIKDILNALTAKLDDATVRRLNNEVSGNLREPAEVAKEFLVQEGLLD
jgi:osmoprotectant transport system substrate-binding protein